MKKYSFLFTAFLLLALASCESKKEAGATSDVAKKNIEANNAILKMFETGDWSKVGDYIANDAVDYAGEKGPIRGLDSIKAYFNEMSAVMTNMKNDVIKTLADDEYVMSWMKGSATAKVDIPSWGMKAGDTHTASSVEVSKFKDGKVIEHWSFMDAADMSKMMESMMGGQTPPVDDTPKKDTTSK